MPLEYEELRQLEQWLFDASEYCDRWSKRWSERSRTCRKR